MDFLNEIVGEVPRAEAISYKPIEEDYLKVMRLEWLITMLIAGAVIAGLMVFLPKIQESIAKYILPLAWALMAAGWYLFTGISYRKKAYALRERDISYRSGLIVHTIRTSPFSRIQHSNVSSGPLERQFGLASLVIYTAGSGGADTRIPGLKLEEAHNIKDWLNKRVSDEPGTGE